MKNLFYKSYIYIIILIGINSISYSQNKNWFLSDSLHNLNGNPIDYIAISCIDSNNCTAISNVNFYMPWNRITSNGGKTWESTLVDTTIRFIDSLWNSHIIYKPSKANCMAYPDSNLCIIGCDSGYYWVSRNKCRTWEKKRLPDNLEIYSISMANSKYGGIFTFDYTKNRRIAFFVTKDSCKTWTKITAILKDTTINISNYSYLTMLDSNNFKILSLKGYDSSSAHFTLIETNDGGITWNINNTDTNTFWGAQSMLFLNKTNGFIISAFQIALYSSISKSIIYRTIDGGKTWEKVLDTLNNNNMNGLEKISFADSLNGIVMGFYGTLWRTTDGGTHWFDVGNPVSDVGNLEFIDISMPTANIIYGADDWNGKIYNYDSNIKTNISERNTKDNDILLYPNPLYSGQALNIKFNLSKPENIKFVLINSFGNIVDTSDEFFLNSGTHKINFNPKTNLSDGVYWLKIIKNETEINIKGFVILK